MVSNDLLFLSISPEQSAEDSEYLVDEGFYIQGFSAGSQVCEPHGLKQVPCAPTLPRFPTNNAPTELPGSGGIPSHPFAAWGGGGGANPSFHHPAQSRQSS